MHSPILIQSESETKKIERTTQKKPTNQLTNQLSYAQCESQHKTGSKPAGGGRGGAEGRAGAPPARKRAKPLTQQTRSGKRRRRRPGQARRGRGRRRCGGRTQPAGRGSSRTLVEYSSSSSAVPTKNHNQSHILTSLLGCGGNLTR